MDIFIFIVILVSLVPFVLCGFAVVSRLNDDDDDDDDDGRIKN